VIKITRKKRYENIRGFYQTRGFETIESVLYDMEYIHKQLLRKKNMDQIHNFLYWQTYFNQSIALKFPLKIHYMPHIYYGRFSWLL